MLTINATEQSSKVLRWNGLECDIDDIANKFPNRIEKSFDIDNHVGRWEDLRPKQLKIAFFQNIGQIDDIANGWIVHLGWQQ